MFAGQAPANFHRRGKAGFEADIRKARQADKFTGVLALQSPEPKAIFSKMPANPADQRCALQVAQLSREVTHYLRVGAHARKVRQVAVAPLAQHQACTFQFQYRLHGSPCLAMCVSVQRC